MRKAISVCRITCSIGWPKPRSVPSDNVATSSARRSGLAGSLIGPRFQRQLVGKLSRGQVGGNARVAGRFRMSARTSNPRPRDTCDHGALLLLVAVGFVYDMDEPLVLS